MKRSKLSTLTLALGLTVGLTGVVNAEFKEFPAGEEKVINHMQIAAVYLKPIDMDPRGMDLSASMADIHMEADIHATAGNPNGFGAGEWIPYLSVNYKLVNKDTGQTQTGMFMPMIAVDGPHYGANLKMMGPGNYNIAYTIDPPSKNGFGRHSDSDSGVGAWFKTFTTDFDFKYIGIE